MGKISNKVVKTAKVMEAIRPKSPIDKLSLLIKINLVMNIGVYMYLLDIHKTKPIKFLFELIGIVL